MMTHKLRDVPQHMFSNNKMEQSRNISPDSGKDSAPSLRVRSEAELNPRSATTPDHRDHRDHREHREHRDHRDHRERSLSSHLQSQVDSNYQLMLERQHHLEQIQRQHQMQSRHSPLHLSRQSMNAMSPPQHIKNELNNRQKPPADADQPAAKRQLCKFLSILYFVSKHKNVAMFLWQYDLIFAIFSIVVVVVCI